MLLGIHHLHLRGPDVLLVGPRAGGGGGGGGGAWGGAGQWARGKTLGRWAGVDVCGATVGLRRCCGRVGQPGVEGPHQPVERRVVDQVVQDVVQRRLHLGQARPPAAAAAAPLRQPREEAGGGAAEPQRLPLDVAGQALQAGRQRGAGGVQLLGEGARQGQGAGLDDLAWREERWGGSEPGP